MSVNYKLVTYSVTGTTLAEIYKSIESQRPSEVGNAIGATGFFYSPPKYNFQKGQQGYTITSVDVNADSTQWMPSWSPSPKASQCTRKEWIRFLAALKVHEDGHRSNFESFPTKLIASALAISPQPNKQTLKLEFNKVVKNIWNKIESDGKAYDVSTQHGKTQGAELDIDACP